MAGYKIVAVMILGGLLLGFGIGSSQVAPSYGVAYLDDQERTYVALPCLAEWQSRQSAKTSLVRQATIGEGSKAGYKADVACRENGGFVSDGRSLSGLLLEKVGILPPVTPWWDRPYRTESGEIVYPAVTARE